MTINKFRGLLYRTAKYLGDVQAVQQAAKKRSPRPIARRIGRRIAGRIAGRSLGWLFRGGDRGRTDG